MIVKILAVGDVCGQPGLDCLEKRLKPFQKENDIAFTVVNGENANVVGITPKQADLIFRAGADVITLGNHTWTRTEMQPYLAERTRILRPANFGPTSPSARASCARQTSAPSARAGASRSITGTSGTCAF